MIASTSGARTPSRAVARRLAASAALGIAVGAALLASYRLAGAHARLERSLPAAGAVLATPPAAIELWFNELLDDSFNDVAVFRAKADGAPADETSFTSAQPRVDDADRTRLITPLATLAPGAYVVHWRVLSRDGHSARGRVQFTISATE